MERKIGETFEFEGKWLKVKEEDAKNACRNCYLVEKDCSMYLSIIGECLAKKRSDSKGVVFEDITYELEEQPQEVEQPQEEQPQEEQPQKLNLCEILKDCPKGTKLYSPIFGEVDFEKIRSDNEYAIITKKGSYTATFTEEGFYRTDVDGECLLFPSKDQRDWSKFNAPWLKKERFDPKTLKPFDKVLVRVFGHHIWKVDFYSHKGQGKEFPYICVGNTYKYCIPYNDDTKHLIGTTDEAPKFYRHLED